MTDELLERRTERVTAIAGLAFVVLLLAELVTWGNPQLHDPAAHVRSIFTSHSGAASTSLTLAVFSVVPLLVFSAGLRRIIRRNAQPEIWSGVLSSAAAVFAAAQLTFAALSGAMIVGAPQATDHELALLLGPLTYMDAARFMPFAVMTAAAGLLVRNTARFRRWIGYIGLASAVLNLISQVSLLDYTGTTLVGKLGNAGQLGFLLFIIWAIAVARTLLRNQPTRATAAGAALTATAVR